MFCPHCGEPAPPGPLDVRNCAPRSRVSTESFKSRLLKFRWAKFIYAFFQASLRSKRRASPVDRRAGLPRA